MNKEIDVIYDAVDEMLVEGNFEAANLMLAAVIVDDTPSHQLLAYLTVTLPAHDLLPFRGCFFDDVKSSLIRRGEYEDDLLTGLEGRD